EHMGFGGSRRRNLQSEGSPKIDELQRRSDHGKSARLGRDKPTGLTHQQPSHVIVREFDFRRSLNNKSRAAAETNFRRTAAQSVSTRQQPGIAFDLSTHFPDGFGSAHQGGHAAIPPRPPILRRTPPTARNHETGSRSQPDIPQ